MIKIKNYLSLHVINDLVYKMKLCDTKKLVVANFSGFYNFTMIPNFIIIDDQFV